MTEDTNQPQRAVYRNHFFLLMNLLSSIDDCYHSANNAQYDGLFEGEEIGLYAALLAAKDQVEKTIDESMGEFLRDNPIPKDQA